MEFIEILICLMCIGILIAYFMWKSYRQDKAKEREYIYNSIIKNLISTYKKTPYEFASLNNYNTEPAQIDNFIYSYIFEKLKENRYNNISFITFCGDIERLPDIEKSLEILKMIYQLGLGFGLHKNQLTK